MAKISTNDLATFAVDKLLQDVSVADVSRQIAAYLIEERRTKDLPIVMRAVEEELSRRGQTQVEIVSARKVSDSVKQQLATLLDAKNPTFSEFIDPSVIGGVKAKAGEKQIDLTVQGRLQRFKAKLVN